VKKLLQIERVGKDIEKILQRYLLALTAHNDKLLLYALSTKALLPLPSKRPQL